MSKLECHFNRWILVQENDVWRMAAILSRPQCVNRSSALHSALSSWKGELAINKETNGLASSRPLSNTVCLLTVTWYPCHAIESWSSQHDGRWWPRELIASSFAALHEIATETIAVHITNISITCHRIIAWRCPTDFFHLYLSILKWRFKLRVISSGNHEINKL